MLGLFSRYRRNDGAKIEFEFSREYLVNSLEIITRDVEALICLKNNSTITESYHRQFFQQISRSWISFIADRSCSSDRNPATRLHCTRQRDSRNPLLCNLFGTGPTSSRARCASVKLIVASHNRVTREEGTKLIFISLSIRTRATDSHRITSILLLLLLLRDSFLLAFTSRRYCSSSFFPRIGTFLFLVAGVSVENVGWRKVLYVSDRRLFFVPLFGGWFRDRETASDYWVFGVH